ncbi:hypothetical protein AU252_05155 [Pseudarthrobacter sulfonivorans]|uniref:site-specific DNA-methyltransferase (adenine-specific) n=1 Tax=Pseudarthrobacter sulfonivorans TaxID=121292 RepID=A0A0U3PEH7_9MICC|nr:BREX-1 system adenine-specific DNA-methyltransferase PglX [Pseudarthrobacter sulfonivorans]ALV40632.1 hypothetical protein AU252_05155 [Pseudarthrobacter sulfonivorans]
MDLSLLRGFAAGVRVELVGVVAARLAGVLLPGSVERVEFPEAVRRLEGVIARSGRDVVVDQVAYTWFNRLVALRFMDVNGYTGVGVVSPGGGAVAGQPEVLADAKAGHVDAGVVGEKVRDRVIGLLSGSVVSRDGQGEAFKLLLAAYCNHWAGPMPFMFERSGDFTELLVPDDLLSDRSIVARIVRTLTPEVCSDVEVIGWLYQFYIAARKDEVFAGFKKNKKATAKEIPAATQLFTPHWIVKYLVENSLGRLWLLNNPHSELASRMEYYIAPVEPETDFLKISGPEELKVLDPACGSGHMLTYAFDLLFLMYEEAGYAPSDIPGLILKQNLFGAEIDPRAGALAAFALVMKARAQQKSFLSPGKGTEPNICVLQPVRFSADELETLVTRGGDKSAETAFWQAFEDADTFGSLIRPNHDLIAPLTAIVESLGAAETLFGGDVLDRVRTVIRQSEYLSTRYHVVVANPPYMGNRNMNSKLSDFALSGYEESKADLFAMFIERGFDFVSPSGYCSMVTMQSWMFISSYTGLREKLLRERHIECMVHMGNMVMGIAFGTAATVWRASGAGSRAAQYDFIEAKDLEGSNPREFPVVGARHARIPAKAFSVLPGTPIAYWLEDSEFSLFKFARQLGSVAQPRKGMDTGRNEQFLRFWFEISYAKLRLERRDTARKWVPYNKGGALRRWYGNREYVINWENSGHEIKARLSLPAQKPTIRNEKDFFREGFTYSTVTSSSFSARWTPDNSIFDNGGCTVFSDVGLGAIGAFLNSSLAKRYFEFLAPTLNFQPGDISRLPIAEGLFEVPLESSRCVAIAKEDWDTYESSWDFGRNPLVMSGASGSLRQASEITRRTQLDRVSELAQLEQRNDAILGSLYVSDSSSAPAPRSRPVTLFANPEYRFGVSKDDSSYKRMQSAADAVDLVSYAVGCMFGRYSLDVPGLVLADQGDTLAQYLAKVPSPSFMPDEDNVLPVLSDGWFGDDIAERFRAFLKVSFGDEHFEENLRFIEDALGKDIRKYFVQDFYKDHVQRYKKRPIYWMFSSPKGSFNALIYMHRYRPDTVSVVLNDYLHEYQAKLRARRANLDQVTVSTLSTVKEQTAARKESEQIGKTLLELEEWEQSVLYPLATEQVAIDLDDGVKANYPKFGTALKKIVGLEANE